MSEHEVDVYIDEEPEMNQTITGFHGSFNTSDSYSVNYLLSGLNVKGYKLLDIASEAFSFDQVDFEEMVQRDVDIVRVQDEIIDQYLKKGKEKALFFPPLIVSIIAFDKDDKPIHQFREIYETEQGKKLIKRWDNFFAIEAIRSESDTGAYLDFKDSNLPIHPYASKIRYNDKLVKLVVIDGQHRFYALRALAKTDPALVNKIHLPICIVFSPDAMEKNGQQDVMVNLRSMFVTINNKAKEVSGHFLDLLNDHSIASFCVRELANAWKQTSEDSLRSKLQFMEWNQRSKGKSYQINKQHSITTVSIITEVLRKNVFANKDESKTFNLLKLGTKRDDLEKYPHSTSADYITDSDFDAEQSSVIRELAKDNIVPCLDVLLTGPSVYETIQNRYLDALKLLEDQVAKGVDGWETFRDLLREFKETNKLSPEPAKLAEREFNRAIFIEREIEIYRRNVFQQAYIRLWARLSDYLNAEYNIQALDVAKALVHAYEVLVFRYKEKLFDKEQPYTNLALYDKSGKPNVTMRGKQLWTEMLTCFLSHQNTIEAFCNKLVELDAITENDIDKFKPELRQWGIEAIRKYCAHLRERIEKDFMDNWRMKEFPKPFKDRLEKLLEEDTDESKEKYTELLDEKSQYSFAEAIEPFLSQIGVEKKLLNLAIVSPDYDQI